MDRSFSGRVAGMVVVGLLVSAIGAAAAQPSGCARISDGTITDSAGNAVVLGYDQYGYNYQAHMFNGTYDSSDRKLDGLFWEDPSSADYADDSLIMKWSDAWLANVDCNGDNKLDRGLGTGGFAANESRGWLTNQTVGDYTDAAGAPQHYTYFSKIVWVGPGGSLWGRYEIVLEVYNDPAAGSHGVQRKIGVPGFGLNDGWTTTN